MLIHRLVELLTPLPCLQCGRDGEVLCGACVEVCGLRKPQLCFRCGVASGLGRTCGRCVEQSALVGVSVGAPYNGAVKDLVWRLKFYRLQAAARVAAQLVLQSLPEDLAVEMVTAVPVAPKRYRERGYNQSALIARAVAQGLAVPYAPLLGRTTLAHQVGRDRETRLQQIKGAFYARRWLEGDRVLVVDDVVTTGATLNECAETLLAAGAGTVWGAVVARH